MKIIISIILSMLIFSSCSNTKADEQQGYHTFNFNYRGCFSYNNGEIFTDAIGRLHYVDFDSMNAVFICPNPNCPHTDGEICPSYGMSGTSIAGCTVVFDGKLYYHNLNDHYDKSGEYIEEIDVYSADIDGTNRKKVGIIDNQSIISNGIYGDGKLYFHYPKKLDDGKEESYIRCYDYESNSLAEYGPILESYHPGEIICGEDKGEIYFMIFYNTEKQMTGPDVVEDAEFFEYLQRITRVIYRKINVETGEIAEWVIPEKIKAANNMDVYATIKDGYFIYSDSKSTLAVTPDGKEYFFDGYDACNIAILNDMVLPYLSSGDNTAIDLKSGELINVGLNEKSIEWAYVCGYCDGKYVIRHHDNEKWYAYKKVDLEMVR